MDWREAARAARGCAAGLIVAALVAAVLAL